MATRNSSRAKKTEVEKPMETLDRLIKTCGTGAYSLFSITCLRRRDDHTHKVTLWRDDFEIYKRSLDAKNNLLCLRPPTALIEKAVTLYKGGAFDVFYVQAFREGTEDKETLKLGHVSEYY